MKKISILVLLLIVCNIWYADAANILPNTSFEGDPMPAAGAIYNGTSERSSNMAKSGTNSLKIIQTHATNGPSLNYSGLSVTANKTYYFSAWVALDTSTVGNTQFYIRFGDMTKMFFTKSFSSADGFIFVSGMYTPTADATGLRYNLAFNPISGVPIVGYIDDVVLEEIPPTTQHIGTTYNKLGDSTKGPICPKDAEIALSFSYDLDATTLIPQNIIASSTPTIVPDPIDAKKFTIKLSSEFNSIQKIQVKNLKDKVGRAIGDINLQYKTTGKIFIENKTITPSTLTVGTMNATISGIKNLSAEQTNVSVILALYKDNELIKIDANTAQITSNENLTSLSTSINVEEIGAGYTLKMYMWDDLISGVTLMEELEI